MSVTVPAGLPAAEILRNEGLPVGYSKNCCCGNKLNILILNLMPTKQVTETQLIRMLAFTGEDIDVKLMKTVSYVSKNTDSDYLNIFYGDFASYSDKYFDGLIITGAPVEHLDFSQVLYWDEFCRIYDWAETHTRSVYSICWGAQASLYCGYGIEKHPLPKKMFGVFPHTVLKPENELCRGLPSVFYAPHSRHAEFYAEDIEKNKNLSLLSVSEKAGVFLVASNDGRRFFATGHPEYDAQTLSLEYFRDVNKGEKIDIPENYFPNDDPVLPPPLVWRDTGKIIFGNWIKSITK